jgi:hypothetical protein
MYLGFWYLFNCSALSILVLATQGHVGRHIAEINRLDRREVNHPLHLSVLYPSLLQIFGECRNELAASIVELCVLRIFEPDPQESVLSSLYTLLVHVWNLW